MDNEMNRQDHINHIFRTIGIVLFSAVLLAGFVLGCFFPKLRPEKSELENRELTALPEFSAESFLSGEYTSGLSTWYADTYPFREPMLKAEMDIQRRYGFRKDAVSAVADNDELPDLDELLSSIAEETEPETPEPETSEPKPTEMVNTEPETTEEESTEPETTIPESVDGQEIYNNNPQEAGAVNVKDLVGYCVYGFNRNAADQYALHVGDVSEGMKYRGRVFELLIPNNSAIMLDEKTKKEWKLLDESKVIDYFTAMTYSHSKKTIFVNIYDTLMEHRDEYLYFKTDHHWTQLGAYYAYVRFCEEAGFEPHELSEYKEVDSGPFLGSYYKTNGYGQLADNPDHVIGYEPISTNDFSFYDPDQEKMRDGKLVRNMSEYDIGLKYQGFISGDLPYSIAHNPNLSDGSCCILVKESFGNCFAPFLIDHYETLIVIDYRYNHDSLLELAKEYEHPDIVFCNNLEAISDNYVMEQLGGICW